MKKKKKLIKKKKKKKNCAIRTQVNEKKGNKKKHCIENIHD